MTKEEILEKYKHLDQTDKFVGEQFPTPDGGTLTVVGWDGSKVSRNKKYTLHCSICSADGELWPEGSLCRPKFNIEKGEIPCACTCGDVRWKEFQFKIRVQRLCDSKGFTFKGWYGDFNGTHTKLRLYNPMTGNRWTSFSINNLMKGYGDPSLRSAKISENQRNDKEFLKSLNYPQAYVIERNLTIKDKKGRNIYWDFSCPVCSKDIYVQAGLCSGKFITYDSTLRKGGYPCRCSSSYKWTKEQIEYDIRTICDKEGLKFLGWKGTYEGKKNSRFFWRCKENHLCVGNPCTFINLKRRCSVCSKQEGWNGYYPKRKDDLDTLYIVSNGEWVKCGRSFNLKGRLSDVKRYSRSDSIEVVATFQGKHRVAFETEQYIKQVMYAFGLNFYEGDGYTSVWEGSTECYKMESLQEVLSKVENIEGLIRKTPA